LQCWEHALPFYHLTCLRKLREASLNCG
jgi:hypothetical protein